MVSTDRLRKLLLDKNTKRDDLLKITQINNQTSTYLLKNESKSIDVFIIIRLGLKCISNDIHEFSNKISKERILI